MTARDIRNGAVLVLGATVVALGIGWGTPGAHQIICPTEDSANCLWIGPLQGNGQGAIIWNGPEGQ